jgi:hypothetical protein
LYYGIGVNMIFEFKDPLDSITIDTTDKSKPVWYYLVNVTTGEASYFNGIRWIPLMTNRKENDKEIVIEWITA